MKPFRVTYYKTVLFKYLKFFLRRGSFLSEEPFELINKMFYYHESETDETRIDQKPLLGDTKLAELIRIETNPIYVNECYFKKTSMAHSYQANESVELSLISSVVRQTEADCLYGLFVISFDTRLGNTIEWQVPVDLNLKNIEFKAMCSGFHLMENDLV